MNSQIDSTTTPLRSSSCPDVLELFQTQDKYATVTSTPNPRSTLCASRATIHQMMKSTVTTMAASKTMILTSSSRYSVDAARFARESGRSQRARARLRQGVEVGARLLTLEGIAIVACLDSLIGALSCVEVWVVCIVLWALGRPISYQHVYHLVRGQDQFQMLVLYNMGSVLDRFLAVLGGSLLDSQSQSNSFNRTTIHRHLRRLLAGLLCAVHTHLLLLQCVVINVALNSTDGAQLLAVLLASNVMELNSSVFKRLAAPHLFQVACGDAVELFQIVLLFMVVAMHNVAPLSPAAAARWLHRALVALAGALIFELGVDWLKHALLGSLNAVESRLYQAGAAVIANDVLLMRSPQAPAPSSRLGLVPQPLACLLLLTPPFASMVNGAYQQTSTILLIILVSIACWIAARALVRVLLVAISARLLPCQRALLPDELSLLPVKRYTHYGKSLPKY